MSLLFLGQAFSLLFFKTISFIDLLEGCGEKKKRLLLKLAGLSEVVVEGLEHGIWS